MPNTKTLLIVAGAFVAGLVAERKFALISKIPVVRDWL